LLLAALVTLNAGCTESPPTANVTTPQTVVTATTPTVRAIAAVAGPTPGAATPTATARLLAALTPTPVLAIPTEAPSVTASERASSSDGATPDRPFGPRTKNTACNVHDGLPEAHVLRAPCSLM
jgi:hypothetical protein